METVLLGGVAFGTPPSLPAGSPVEQGAEFKLYSTYEDILKDPYRHGTHYVVTFKQSVRGLESGAAVRPDHGRNRRLGGRFLVLP